ncbi:MAG: hypothetical protein IPI67_39475 [Myxococcales bacterium]|nr:hypothetical protein [Myxococcales bacterium]
MRARGLLGWGVGLLLVACGGSEFGSEGSGGAGGAATGGSSASGGAATGGTSGASGGSGGLAGGAGSGGSMGGAPSGGVSGVGGAPGDASTDSSVDAGPQPIAVVQASAVKLSTSPEAVSKLTLSATPQPGNAIIVGITCISEYGYDGDAGVAGDCVLSNGSVADNQGNTYTRVVQGEPLASSHQKARSYIFIAQNIAAAGSFIISVDPEGPPQVQGIAWGAIEVAGLKAPPSLDAWGLSLVGGTNATTTTATTDLATTQANELAVGVLTMRSDDTNMMITQESGWVSHQVHQNSTSANMNPPGHSMVSKLLTSSGKISHTWTHDMPTRSVAGVIATFKGASTD